MMKTVLALGFSALPCFASWALADWQKHANWCIHDPKNSGADYFNSCVQGLDQFDSVLNCQRHSSGAQAAIRAAGRDAVNQWMASRQPAQCKTKAAPPPPPSFYVKAQFECAGSGYTGSCEITQTGTSCDDAHSRIMSTSNQCAKCSGYNNMPATGRYRWVHGDACFKRFPDNWSDK